MISDSLSEIQDASNVAQQLLMTWGELLKTVLECRKEIGHNSQQLQDLMKQLDSNVALFKLFSESMSESLNSVNMLWLELLAENDKTTISRPADKIVLEKTEEYLSEIFEKCEAAIQENPKLLEKCTEILTQADKDAANIALVRKGSRIAALSTAATSAVLFVKHKIPASYALGLSALAAVLHAGLDQFVLKPMEEQLTLLKDIANAVAVCFKQLYHSCRKLETFVKQGKSNSDQVRWFLELPTSDDTSASLLHSAAVRLQNAVGDLEDGLTSFKKACDEISKASSLMQDDIKKLFSSEKQVTKLIKVLSAFLNKFSDKVKKEREIFLQVMSLEEFKMEKKQSRIVRQCAELNQLCYTIGGEMKSEMMILKEFEESKELSVPWLIAQSEDGKCLFLAFRGSVTLENWKGNMTCAAKPIAKGIGVLGHDYVLQTANVITGQLSQWLQDNRQIVSNVRSIVLTGHSLGGAVALTVRGLALEWENSLENSVELDVVTFGAPAVIAAPGGKQDPNIELQVLFGDLKRVTHFVHMHDVVPKVFQTALEQSNLQRIGKLLGVDGYFHPGNVVIVGNCIKPRVIPIEDSIADHHSKQLDTLKTAHLMSSPSWISHHSMESYVQHSFST
jgi:hypothetical protein